MLTFVEWSGVMVKSFYIFCSCLLWSTLTAQTIAPLKIDLAESGKYRIEAPVDEDHYAILFRSNNLKDWQPVDLSLADSAGAWLNDSGAPREGGFFEVSLIPKSSPLDSDNDGRSDLEELTNATSASALNPANPLEAADGAISLPTLSVFDRLSKRDNFPGAQNVKEVKFLITDIQTNPRLHFIDVKSHQFHFYFARDVLNRYNYNGGNAQFNRETYFGNSNRRNLAGSLVAHDNYLSPDEKQGIYTLEFWPTDPVPFQWIELAYTMISRSAPFMDRLAYHAPSETQREILREAQEQFDESFIHTIETDELFANTDFQPMHQRKAFGRLRVAGSGGTLSARDIVIFANLPNDLSLIAGIITEVPQTPLSHVNLKAQQNDTPNAFIANARTHPDIAPFIGQNISYEVTAEGFKIEAATQEELDEHFESIRPPNESFPPRDLSEQEIQPLAAVSFYESDSFGGKAANVAELQRLFPNNAPDGFAIPFYFYDEFMKHNGLYDEARIFLENPLFLSNPAVREGQLKAFRKRIKEDGSFPPWMFNALTTLQSSFPAEITPRLRSSANAEDSVTFNGAGLYDSFTHKADEGHIGKSVRQVWASLWNYRAYEEREFYRIDHLTSAMGILVHPNNKGEEANGVAVARNIFDPNWDGHYINVQVGENLVTNPEAGTTPEEMLVAQLLGTTPYEIQYIRSSSELPLGERILTREQVIDLVGKMDILNDRFSNLYPNTPFDFAMEIEFKITKEGELLIKQARPWVN